MSKYFSLLKILAESKKSITNYFDENYETIVIAENLSVYKTRPWRFEPGPLKFTRQHTQLNNLLEIKRQEKLFEEINPEIIIFNYLNMEY